MAIFIASNLIKKEQDLASKVHLRIKLQIIYTNENRQYLPMGLGGSQIYK